MPTSSQKLTMCWMSRKHLNQNNQNLKVSVLKSKFEHLTDPHKMNKLINQKNYFLFFYFIDEDDSITFII